MARRRLGLALAAGALCLAAGSARAADSDGAAVAATVLYNAHIFTGEPAAPYAQALAYRGDRILAVGERSAVERAAGAGARRVDLAGRFLMPGIVDAHVHPVDGGMTLLHATYPGEGVSVPELAAFVRAQLDRPASHQGDVVMIYNVDTGFWEQVAAIDAALSGGEFANIPILVSGWDGHSEWANRALRQRAGLTRETLRSLPPEQLLYFGHDAALEPNGLLFDGGDTFIEKVIPPRSHETLVAAARAGLHYLNGVGVTAWLDASVAGSYGDVPASVEDPGYLPVYRELAQRGELTAHVAAYPVVRPDSGTSQVEVVQALRERYEFLPDLRVPGLKVFADGIVEPPMHTAALSRPYRDTGRQVAPYFRQASMNALVTEADRRGLVVHVHTIGDRAVSATLDAIEVARRANPGSRLHHTLAHIEFVAAADVPRFAALGVPAAVQLLWALPDKNTIDMVQPFIDPVIYSGIYRARSLLEAGALLAGSSDWPASTANPFEAIYQAETRAGPLGVLNAAERMPREAMLYAYTRNAALVLDALDEFGTLAPGKRADLVLLDRDVLAIPATELREVKVVWTLFGGRAVAGSGP